MFGTVGEVVSVDEWERMKADAYDRCVAEHSDAAMSSMSETTGISWCEPGIPDKLPPTPGVREGMDEAIAHLPRRLRRHARRVLARTRSSGALEVMGILYDGELEATITGTDRRAVYFDYLREIPYGLPVLRFVIAAFKWFAGIDDFEWIRECVVFLYALGLIDDSGEKSTRLSQPNVQQRPPPMKLRPCITADGPPEYFGAAMRPVTSAAA